ncbi:hypothetical protein L804_03549 [Cryptococcus deuterogattii 2001/935-1]|nr:hypothetical protein L804_03549 [Cryptococcus deuterogattii 2001/935-1]
MLDLLGQKDSKQFITLANNAYEKWETGVSFNWVQLLYCSIRASICKVVEEVVDDLVITPEDVIMDPVPAKELLMVKYPGVVKMISFENGNGDICSLNLCNQLKGYPDLLGSSSSCNPLSQDDNPTPFPEDDPEILTANVHDLLYEICLTLLQRNQKSITSAMSYETCLDLVQQSVQATE